MLISYRLRPCVLWFLQAIIVAYIASILTERLTRRMLPMAMLFNLSLAFPGVTPSRVSLALQSQTVQKLLRHEEASYQAASLLMQLAKHDRLTRGHAERVRTYVDVIADELGLGASDRNKLAWGALLHDVDKIHVPSEILNKKGKLDPAEYELMQNHPGDSTQLMSGLNEWLDEWRLAASQHHEKFDGTEYPIGLAGRIVAAAEVYDVMTSVRSYKKARPDADEAEATTEPASELVAEGIVVAAETPSQVSTRPSGSTSATQPPQTSSGSSSLPSTSVPETTGGGRLQLKPSSLNSRLRQRFRVLPSLPLLRTALSFCRNHPRFLHLRYLLDPNRLRQQAQQPPSAAALS